MATANGERFCLRVLEVELKLGCEEGVAGDEECIVQKTLMVCAWRSQETEWERLDPRSDSTKNPAQHQFNTSTLERADPVTLTASYED